MGDSAVAQSVTKLVVVWPELSKYLRTCGQKMWNRHCSSIYIASIPAIATATTKNANFQSKQTKAKSNQSEPSRAGKSGNQFVKSNNWNGHERITHATGIGTRMNGTFSVHASSMSNWIPHSLARFPQHLHPRIC